MIHTLSSKRCNAPHLVGDRGERERARPSEGAHRRERRGERRERRRERERERERGEERERESERERRDTREPVSE
jgi:hypothetical protein